MDNKKLQEIIGYHGKWLRGCGGACANLCGADLCGTDLRGANLCGADLCGTDLRGANLYDANLCDANLRDASLRGANLHDANLCGADLCGADLCNADLCGANLSGADLRNAYLSGANLCGADLCGADKNDRTVGIEISCPEEGSFIGYKKASGKIVVLKIPEDARRSSATTKKCRCDKALVIRIEEIDGTISNETRVASSYDSNFVYEVGKEISEPKFNADRWNECSNGIHFFINKETARRY